MVDGLCKDNLRAIGGFTTFHNDVLLNWSIFIGACPTTKYAKARSILEGLIQLTNLWQSNAYLLSDSQILISSLCNKSGIIISDWGHIYDCCMDILLAIDITFVKAPWSYTKGVDKLTKYVFYSKCSHVCWGVPHITLNFYLYIFFEKTTYNPFWVVRFLLIHHRQHNFLLSVESNCPLFLGLYISVSYFPFVFPQHYQHCHVISHPLSW